MIHETITTLPAGDVIALAKSFFAFDATVGSFGAPAVFFWNSFQISSALVYVGHGM